MNRKTRQSILRPLFQCVLLPILIITGSYHPPALAIQPELATYDASKQIRFTTPAEAEQRRQHLITFIWDQGLPTDLPEVEERIASSIFSSDLVDVGASLISRVDRLTSEVANYDYHMDSYLLHPQAQKAAHPPRLAIVHAGHVGKLPGGLGTTANALLAEGYTVLVMNMPLIGWNKAIDRTAVINDQTYSFQIHAGSGSHRDLFNQLEPVIGGGKLFRFFLEPAVEGINYFLQENPESDSLMMTGLSGGGWTTHMMAALDTRIDLSIPVAGSYPLYLRPIMPHRSDPFRDPEQVYEPLYREIDSDDADSIPDTAAGVASWLEIYALGGLGAGRRQIQVLNYHDSCCFSTDAYESYDRFVSGVVRKLGTGSWSFHSDRTHESHVISADVLHRVIMPAVRTQRPSLKAKRPLSASPSNPTWVAPAPHSERAFSEMRATWDGSPNDQAPALEDAVAQQALEQAERNARQASEVLYRSGKFVDGWLAHADPRTGLIARNLTRDRDIWNAKDAAADNYPYMVLTCALIDRPRYYGRMHDMLRSEMRHTCRIDRLPDTYRFSTGAFAEAEPNLDSILFGSSEYVKDGLMPLSEWLGPSPWRQRMVGIIDDIWKHANVDTPYGKIPTSNIEAHGEMLQCLSRIYWMTGDEKYLEWAIRLGDYYLLGDHHPTQDLSQLRLGDHGCEVISGLCELYATVHFARPPKARGYERPIHAMCDRVLEVGRREDGMMYNIVHPQSGEHSSDIIDTWGYNYNGIYTVYLLDGTLRYREAVRNVLGQLRDSVSDYDWGHADQYADTIEGAINLMNREPSASTGEWVDTEIRKEWAKQRPDGIIEGWHGDGNSARTGIMYALWKSQGTHMRPWRKDVRIGGERRGASLFLNLMAESDWQGAIYFDRPRHKDYLNLPLDYPRINQFPEWFTVEAESDYEISDIDTNTKRSVTGADLIDGLPATLQAGQQRRLRIEQQPATKTRL